MSRATALIAGAGLGAGLMFFLDPKKGRQRRAQVRDKMIRASHQIQDMRDTVTRDVRNRMRGLAAGDMTVLVGGKNALRGNPLRGDWSPTGRAILALLGGGLFLRGLMQEAPTACVLGTVGLGLIMEAATNAGIEDITEMPTQIQQFALNKLDHDGHQGGIRKAAREMAGMSN